MCSSLDNPISLKQPVGITTFLKRGLGHHHVRVIYDTFSWPSKKQLSNVDKKFKNRLFIVGFVVCERRS